MKQAAKSVWHVVRFRQRFELPDDLRFDRRRPLVYCRDYVSAADDESAQYLRLMDLLSRRQNGLELEGAWSRIRRAASARSLAYRGFLLTVDNRPASDAEIGRTILFCEPRRASRILQSLAEIGLLEQVRCPIFDESQNDVTARKRRKTPENKAKRRERQSGRRASDSRKTTGKSENRREPLEQRRTGKRNTKVKKNPKSATPRADKKPCPPTAREVENPSSNPQEPAATGAMPSPACIPPRSAVRSDPRQIGNVLSFLHWQDRDAVQFGYDVFSILWPEQASEADSEWGKSERGVYTKWLWKHPPGERQAAIAKGLEIAKHVAKHRKSYRRPGAAWRSIVSGKTRLKAVS